MKNIGIISNLDRDIGGAYLAKVALWLREQSANPIVFEDFGQFVHDGCSTAEEDELYRSSDLIVALGGDGTMINASKFAARHNVPIIGINLGTLGYLTDSEGGPGGIDALGKVLAGEYKTDRRMMLVAEVLDEDSNVIQSDLLALNDVCVLRGMHPKAKSFNLYINGQFLDTYKADGIIIATPTGSTAYNLSAGGPVLKPDMENIAITPICPHKMDSRPLVVCAGDVVSLEVGGRYEPSDDRDILLTLDGQENIVFRKGQSVRVRKSEKFVTLVKTNDLGFYDILRMKLR